MVHTSWRRMVWLGAVALLATGLVVLATRDGVTTTSDSSVYLGVARSIDAGHGLDVPIHYYPLGSLDIGTPPPGRFVPTPTPLVHYAPLAPVLLAIGGHPVGAARVEDALFFGLTVLVVGGLVLAVTDELWAALAAQLVVAFSLAVAVSDLGTIAADLFFTVVALAAVIAHRRKPRFPWLVVAAASIVLGTLVHFAAGALIVWGVLALWRRRRDALALFVMSVVPIGAWFAYEHVSGRGTGHPLGFHPVIAPVRADVRSIGEWIVPANSSTALALLGAIAVVVVVLLALSRRSSWATRLLVLYAVVQLVILGVAITLYDAGIAGAFELVPVFVALVMAVACALKGTATLKALTAVVVVACMARAGADIATAVPAGYTSTSWKKSPIVTAVRALPPHTIIYTNAPDVLYLLADRATSSVPETMDLSTLASNPHLDAQIDEIKRTLATRGGVVVYVDGLDRTFLPSEASLVRRLGLRRSRTTSDGTIYTLANHRT